MKTRTLAVKTLILCTVSAVDISRAATINVEKWGENTPGCGSPSAPCATIQHAVSSRAGPNDRVRVGPGYYEENVIIDQNLDGEDLVGLKLQSTNGMRATIIRTVAVNTHGIAILQPKVRVGKRGKGFTVGGATTAGFAAIAAVGGPERVRVEGNRAILSDWGIFLSGDKSQARFNVAELNNLAGLACENCNGTLIRDNRMRNNGAMGAFIVGSDKLTFQRNVSSHNAGYGIEFGGLSGNLKIRDNASEFNDDSGFLVANSDGMLAQGNIALLNHAYGFDFDQNSFNKPPVARHNLSVFNDFSGFFLDDLVDARVENNEAVSNQDQGFAIPPGATFGTFRRNDSYASGSGCGIGNNSGSVLRSERHFYGSASGADDVLDADGHDASCGANLVSDDHNPKSNVTRTRSAEKL